WEDGQDAGTLRTAEWTLAKSREHARAGVLIDAFADPSFCLAIAQCVATEARVPFAAGELRCEREARSEALDAAEFHSVEYLGAESTNTSVVIDDAVFLKAYRRAEAGPHPDIEMTCYLMRAGYGSIAPYLGGVCFVGQERTHLVGLFS